MSSVSSSQKTAINIWIVLTCLIWTAWLIARLTIGGQCQQPTSLVDDFQPDRYLGRWYEMYREKTIPFESYDCGTATYVKLDQNYIEVNNQEYNIQGVKWGSSNPTKAAKAQCSGFRSGHCQVSFFWAQPWSDYKVMMTDYDSYSVVYGCDTYGAGVYKNDWLWTLARTPLATDSAAHTTYTNTVYGVIDSKLGSEWGDKNERLRPTEHTVAKGCSYSEYPLAYNGRLDDPNSVTSNVFP